MPTPPDTATERHEIRDQLAQPALLINGEERSSSTAATFEDRDPATNESIAAVPEASASDVDDAVAAARAALGPWAAKPPAERARLLHALADALEANQERISRIESLDNGRPRRETGSQAMIIAKWFRYFAGMADKVEGSTIPVEGPYLNYTQRVPVGVCGAITPWNHPMLIATKKIAPALALGNTMVVKPSELAPLSVIELGRLATEVGIPPGVLNVITGGRDAGSALAEHSDIDRVDVTGSTPTGIAVAKAAAGNLKRLGFELGGKAANIVFADADIERALRGVLFSAFIAQGQSCVSGSRILVQRELAEQFAQRLAGMVEQIRLGDPLDTATQMGPVIQPAAAQRIRAFAERAANDGAGLLTGGWNAPEVPAGLSPDSFVTPTLLRTDDNNIAAMQEEPFGPIAVVMPFETEAEAIEIANGVPFGLGAGVWTQNSSRGHRIAHSLEAGITWINDYHRIDAASPWGGFKLSGYGRENGWSAVEEYTEVKSVWVPLEEQEMNWYESTEKARLN